jgi:hypothetical protein
MFDLETKQGKLFKALVLDGEKLTEAEIRKRFSIKNPRATVSDIRYAGYPIYADSEIAANHQRVTRYRHGTASRKLVRAGYKALRMNLV